MKDNRTIPIDKMMDRVNKSLIGHYNYYGVSTNVKRLGEFRHQVERIIFKTLNMRSQKKSFTWNKFREGVLANYPLAKARIYAHI